MQRHRVEWFCNISGHPQYEEKHDFLEHMKLSHHTTFNVGQESEVLGMFKRPSRTAYGKCNLCYRLHVKIKSHVARHLEQMALFALPRANEAAGHDSEELDSTAGVNGKLQTKNSLDTSSGQKESRKSRDSSANSRGKWRETEDEQEPYSEGKEIGEDIEQVQVPDAEVTAWDPPSDKALEAVPDGLPDDASISTLLRICQKLCHQVSTEIGPDEYYYLLRTLKSLIVRLEKLQRRCVEAELLGDLWYTDVNVLITPDGVLGRLRNKFNLLSITVGKASGSSRPESLKWLDENAKAEFQPFIGSLIDLGAEIMLIIDDPAALARSTPSSRVKEEHTQPTITGENEATFEHGPSTSAQPIELKPTDLLWICNPNRRLGTLVKPQGSSWSHKAQSDGVDFRFLRGVTFEHLDVPRMELTTLEEEVTSPSASTTTLALDMSAFIYEAVYEPSERARVKLSKRGRENAYRLHCIMDVRDPPQRCHGIYIDSSTAKMSNGERKSFFLIVQRLQTWSNECRRIGVACSAEEGTDHHLNMVTTSRPELGLVRIL